MGVPTTIAEVRKLTCAGRPCIHSNRRRSSWQVVFIGADVADRLLPTSLRIGKVVAGGNPEYQVIGVAGVLDSALRTVARQFHDYSAATLKKSCIVRADGGHFRSGGRRK